MKKLFVFLIISLVVSSCNANDRLSKEDKGMVQVILPGFTLRIEESIMENESYADDIKLISDDILELGELISTEAKTKLSSIPIYIWEKPEGDITYNPEKDRIEILNFKSYAKMKKKHQPVLLVNCWALALYDIDADIRESVDKTFSSSRKAYHDTYTTNGIKPIMVKTPPHAADAATYFAELSEAYIGENDYYPFDIRELSFFDENGFLLMKSIWGDKDIPVSELGIDNPPRTLRQWLKGVESRLDPYYSKYLSAGGLPVLSSRFVADEALVQAAYIIRTMTSRVPEAITVMLDNHFRVGIIGKNENVTDMPECRVFPVLWPDTDWDARGRGYGATEYIPLMSCGEENIIKVGNDRYYSESIMVHEFAHNVDFALRIADRSFGTRLDNLYKSAMSKKLWAGSYSESNSAEYFAEASQAWFDTCRMSVTVNGKAKTIVTREDLQSYDPDLWQFLSEIYPEEKLTGYHF